MTDPTFHVVDDPAAAVAALLVETARLGGSIVLTGGSSPGRAYELAAALEPDWSRAQVWWGDERCVAPGDERSNFGLAKKTLLDRLAGRPTVYRMRGEIDPAEAAGEYAEQLAGVTFDLLLLGLGPDGHVASLFPHSPQLGERDRPVTHGPPGLEPFVERLTLTLPALLAARRIVVLTTGAEKAEAVDRGFRRPPSEDVPASLLRASDAPLDVYLDAPAATGAAAS
jgi:6-phosphogluconolactonase